MKLQAQERRLVVGITAIVFVVLNLWFVWPHFGDWKRARAELDTKQQTLARYQRETNPTKIAEYNARLKQLEGEGSSVAATEQALNLIRTIQTEAGRCGFVYDQNTVVPTASSTKTNEYFEEKAQQLTFSATGEKQLVDFLVSLGSTNSLIRAKSIVLKPNANHMYLQGQITLVASYQKAPKKIEAAPKGRQMVATAKPGAAGSPLPLNPKTNNPSTSKLPAVTPRVTTPAKDAAVKSNLPAVSPKTRDKSMK
jgi:hypothetical protein